MNIVGYIPESISEGDGVRAVIYIAGCRHACKGCFSKHTWDFNAGEKFTEELQRSILSEIADNPLLDGITLCGGDPFMSSDELYGFVSKYKEMCPNGNVWAYSGFTYEAIARNESMSKLLSLCDVLIDGKFDISLRDVSLKYRGSSNQRIVDVKNSSIGNVAVIN